jgi:ABC-type uncharacterized transport system substrate-binding protein
LRHIDRVRWGGLIGRTAGAAKIRLINPEAPTGGLMSYGPNFKDLYRRSADHVDKVLRGTKPGDIPVEQPVRFDLVVSMITAKAIGLTTSEAFLLRADEVIE